MKCDICGYVYFHNAAAAVGGIILYKDSLVLIRRGHDPGKGMLDLPGGFVDYRESAEEALKREVKEEINLDVAQLNYFGSASNVYTYKGVTYFTSDVFYLIRVDSVDSFIPTDEVPELVLADPLTIDTEQLAFESAKVMIKQYCNTIKKK